MKIKQYWKLKSDMIFYKIAITLLGYLLMFAPANAGTIVQCGQQVCTSDYQVMWNGNNVGGGEFTYDSQTGEIALKTTDFSGSATVNNSGGLTWTLGNGDTASVNSVSGNADPILGFGLAATTAGAGSNFAFAFNLPIAITGTINTSSSASYSLTSFAAGGAQIKGVGGNKVVQSWDVDTSVGGIADLNKKVDVGDTHFHLGGPATTSSPIYSDTDTITGNLAYDNMHVLVNFSLSAQSAVGITGYVSQTPVPLPAALPLFLIALSGVGVFSRRNRNSAPS